MTPRPEDPRRWVDAVRSRGGRTAAEMALLSPGTIVDGRYRIEALAGRGGMAVVYEATHIKLRQRVAVKVIAPERADDPEFRDRFDREALSMAEIARYESHVVPVYDYGEHGSQLYLVMNYIEGRNLRAELEERGPLEVGRALDVLADVASALDAAHARKILHRDVKPANILIESSTGRVYLADFGLARAIAEDEISKTRSRVMGTDWYMAPERLRGEDTELGDVYSLGCVLWEMLVGLGAQLPGYTTRERQEQLPPPLVRVVERSVQLEPAARYRSAGELARAARKAAGTQIRRVTDPGRRAPADAELAGEPEIPPFLDPLSSVLVAQVVSLCDTTLPALAPDDPARLEIADVRRRLGSPLTIVVAGAPAAGKSTLINALLERRVAPKREQGAYPVTWFNYGTAPRLALVRDDGTRETPTLSADGVLPALSASQRERVAAVEVWLPLRSLRGLTLIDTPGVDLSARAEPADAAGTDEETRAVQQADALLFVLRGDADVPDRDAVAAFRRRFGLAGHASSANAVAVMTRADVLALGPAGWDAALARAGSLRAALGSRVSAVVPIAGLLAETATAGKATGALGDYLVRLAALDAREREELLRSLSDAPIGASPLLELLGRYGLRRALELVGGNVVSSHVILQQLSELSGVGELRKHITNLKLRADALKADLALRALEDLSWRYPERLAELRDRIEAVRLRGRDMHLLEVIRDFDEAMSGQLELDPGMLAELERLIIGGTEDERLGLPPAAGREPRRAAALRLSDEWRTFANEGRGGFRASQLASNVARSFELIAASA
ncbi:MAG TPA: serine/threonine-protein kinase [Solirubrobacteraceae bacterium]|nr:serine/threonine-protein kinase [Solirubrobacteraceae bacterium]